MKVEENKMIINKITKILVIMIIFVISSIPVFARVNPNMEEFSGESVSPGGSSNPNLNLDAFPGGSVPSSVQNLTDNTIGAAIGVVRIVGIGIAITIMMVLAIKYMMASAGDRADIKRHAVPFVVGAIVLFGATGILGILVDFAASISGS